MNTPIIEIIGLTCTVVDSTNKELVGITGKIITENKNVLTLDTKSGEKLIPKNTCKFNITKNNDVIEVSGSRLSTYPYERLEVLS